MTGAAVFCKVSLLLAQTRNKEEITALFCKDSHGELSDKEYVQRGKPGGIIQFFESKAYHHFKTEEQIYNLIGSFLPYATLDACKYNKFMVLEELYSYNNRLFESQSYEGFGIMHSQVFNYNQRILEFVTGMMTPEAIKKEVNKKTIYGITPLDYCIKTKAKVAMNGLMEIGAKYDPDQVDWKIAADFLEYIVSYDRAAETNDLEAIELHLMAGLDRFQNVKNFEGKTPVHIVNDNDLGCGP